MMRSSGFTLLEVLVASFILFISISTATVVYSSALKSKISATHSIRMSAYVPLIRDDIKIKLRKEQSDIESGTGTFMGISYQWRASVEQKKDSVSEFLVEDGVLNSEKRKIKLWLIKLTITEQTRTSQYEFYATGWQP